MMNAFLKQAILILVLIQLPTLSWAVENRASSKAKKAQVQGAKSASPKKRSIASVTKVKKPVKTKALQAKTAAKPHVAKKEKKFVTIQFDPNEKSKNDAPVQILPETLVSERPEEKPSENEVEPLSRNHKIKSAPVPVEAILAEKAAIERAEENARVEKAQAARKLAQAHRKSAGRSHGGKAAVDESISDMREIVDEELEGDDLAEVTADEAEAFAAEEIAETITQTEPPSQVEVHESRPMRAPSGVPSLRSAGSIVSTVTPGI